MDSSKTQLLLTGVAAWMSLLAMITTTYGSSIVIGGNYTDIGTIVIVSPKPGDTPLNNGMALLNNIAEITGDVNNPYLIKLGPGIYDMGPNIFQMKSYIDVEGSGENTTIITGHVDSDTSGVVQGANHAEIRFLTVQNTGGSHGNAVYNNGLDTLIIILGQPPILIPSTLKMTHITVSASGGSVQNIAVNNNNSSPTMTNVTASASGGTASTANTGISNSSSSPTIANVTVSASGGTFCTGISNSSSSPAMANVTISASGGTDVNSGVLNLSSSPTMTNVTVSVSQGTNENYGVYNISSFPVMTNVTVSSSGTTGSNYGIENVTSGIVRINHSVIKASGRTIDNTAGITTYVGNTQLDGEAVYNTGSLTCVGAYNGNYVALGANCQ